MICGPSVWLTALRFYSIAKVAHYPLTAAHSCYNTQTSAVGISIHSGEGEEGKKWRSSLHDEGLAFVFLLEAKHPDDKF